MEDFINFGCIYGKKIEMCGTIGTLVEYFPSDPTCLHVGERKGTLPILQIVMKGKPPVKTERRLNEDDDKLSPLCMSIHLLSFSDLVVESDSKEYQGKKPYSPNHQ